MSEQRHEERPQTGGPDAQTSSGLRKRDTRVPPQPGTPGKQVPQSRQAQALQPRTDSRTESRTDATADATADARTDTRAGTPAATGADTTADARTDTRTGTRADTRTGTRTDTAIRAGEVRPDRPRYTPQTGRDDSARDSSRNGDAASSRNGDALLAHGEGDKLGLRLQQAVGGFVDQPRKAVEEADSVLEEAAARLTEGITARRRALRSAWQGDAAKNGTEEMRIALRDYRDLVQRLLHT